MLCEPFSEKEILEAVRSCDGGKAPGPDGFSLRFFKVFWVKFKDFFVEVLKEFHSSGFISGGCNSSFVALIPKCKDPQDLSNFRPISLVASTYKIIAKVLASRIKRVIGEISSSEQSAFVGGRNILDSTLIVSESIAWAKKSKKELLIFKVDFEKAYDSINWKFLFGIMEKMDFPLKWVSWIKGCLVSGMGSVLVNGSPTKEFSYKRGLRQGDPLSPFLFIIAMEIVTLFVNRLSQKGVFQGCQLPNGGPNITHLCYADDVVFIGSWSEENIIAINRLLRWLNLVSGLKINRRKSKVYGIGVDPDEVKRLASKVNCEAGSLPFSYLGVPIGVNMKRASFWNVIIDRIYSKLSRWKAKHLSFAGRLTLVKSVLGSLPSYFLSLFVAPKCVIKRIEKIRREFLWGKRNNRNKLRWLKWEFILKHKKAGGMGVGGIQSYNYAMLTKWWWRAKQNPNQLWVKVVEAIHGGNHISNSNSIIPVKKSIPGAWKDIGSVAASLSKLGIDIKTNLVAGENGWKWVSDPDGSFSVRQVRKDIDNSGNVDNSDVLVFDWNNWASPKANYLFWRALLGKVASKVGLIRRGVAIGDALCPRCGIKEEDSDHLFVSCLWARCVWWNILSWLRIRYPSCTKLTELSDHIRRNPGDKVWKKLVYTIIMATVWTLWKARNVKVFEDSFIPINKLVDMIKEESFLWICNRSNLKKPSWSNWLNFDVVDLM
ncbi:putative RNA-directed DNA polymerase [Helianthus annuus]|nr:putative RNA-directed DNA polymerase [Helianthus annuus]